MVPRRRLVILYELAGFCEKRPIAGAFVECGVWKGGSMGLMAFANLAHGSWRRDLHLFDSFRDICRPDEKVDGDLALEQARQWARVEGPLAGQLEPMVGFYDHLGGPGRVDDSRRLLEDVIGYDSRLVHYHEGWFQETVPEAAASLGDIALLHLDADYYASTAICLEYLYEHVVSGGFVVIDDYGAYDGCRKAVDGFMAALDTPLYLHHVDGECRYFVKP